jgi:hypothetical protein
MIETDCARAEESIMRSFSEMPNVQRTTLNFQRSMIETLNNPQSAIE